MNCPHCNADISDSYEPDDYSCGITAGWYCDTCDKGIAEWEVGREHGEDGVLPPPEREGPIGTPISQLSGRPGHPGFDEFCRIAKSWGYD